MSGGIFSHGKKKKDKMKHFTIDEFTRSATARALHIDNTPPTRALVALELLAARVLDPLREWWGRPLRITSGYRSEALNRAVGGVASSQHLRGEAADLTAGSRADNARLFRYVAEELPFDQLIAEQTDACGPAWLHVSYRAGRLRRQVMER